MKVPFVPKDVWENLYEVAIRLRELAPWDWIDDYEIFGVENPYANETGYCATLGTLGEVLGLVVYRGSRGLDYHLKISGGEAALDDLLGHHNHLLTEFVSKKELDSEDRKIIGQLGLQRRGQKQYPQFRSYLPGYAPWYLIEAEARFLTFALQCALDAGPQRKKDPSFFALRNNEEYLVYVPVKVAENQFSFSKTWKKPRTIVTSETPLPSIEILELRRNQLQKDSIWEAEIFYTSARIVDRDRPYLLRTVTIAQQSTGLIFALNVIAPEEIGSLAVERQILAAIDQSGLIPQNSTVAR